EHPARAVRHARFRFAAEWNRRHDSAGCNVYHRGRLSCAVERVHLVPQRLEHDEIRIALCVDLRERLECLRVDDAGVVATAVAGEHAAGSGRYGTVNAGRVGDLTYDRVCDRVDDYHFRRVADVEAVRGAVDVQVIPSALTGNRNLFDLAIWSVARLSAGECSEQSGRNERHHY